MVLVNGIVKVLEYAKNFRDEKINILHHNYHRLSQINKLK
jgi:hypothetical protein